LNTQDIAEAIIDGDGDLGIDSILIDESNSALTIMQYKLPSKKENINCEIDQGDILRNCREIICIFLESMLIYVMNEFSDSGGHFHGT